MLHMKYNSIQNGTSTQENIIIPAISKWDSQAFLQFIGCAFCFLVES